jgi:hypothetical protein
MLWTAWIGQAKTFIVEGELERKLKELEEKGYHIESYTDEHHIQNPCADFEMVGRIIPADDNDVAEYNKHILGVKEN